MSKLALGANTLTLLKLEHWLIQIISYAFSFISLGFYLFFHFLCHSLITPP